jgi:hypothetical protein
VWAVEEREHGGKAAISMNVGRGRIYKSWRGKKHGMRRRFIWKRKY